MQKIEHFSNKANRDARAKALKAAGLDVKKSSQRCVVLSPDYVEDFSYSTTPAVENGFGGFSPMMFAVIYEITYNGPSLLDATRYVR